MQPIKSTVAGLLFIFAAAGLSQAQSASSDLARIFDTAPSPTDISICLSSLEVENKYPGKVLPSNLSRLTIRMDMPANHKDTILNTGVKVGFRDSKQTYYTEMACIRDDDSVGSFGCVIFCAGGVTLDLRANADGNVNAEIKVETSNFEDTRGTGSRTEKLELFPVAMKVCTPDSI